MDAKAGDRVELKVRPLRRIALGTVTVRNGNWLKVRYSYGTREKCDMVCHVDDVVRVVRGK